MSANFSSKAISAVLLAATLLLGGCGAREPKVITPPKDAAAVIEPFLREIAAGNKDKAAAFVSSAATDELAKQFAEDHKRLAAAGTMTPRFASRVGDDSDVNKELAEIGDVITVIYASQTNGKWTSATVRVYKYRDEPFKVEYWRIANEAPQKPLTANVASKQLQQSEAVANATIIGMSIFGLFGIALLIWMVRRKPHLLVPETAGEIRRSASTVREADE